MYTKRGETDPKMIGDVWQGFDEKKQIQQLTIKLNEIIDFLERTIQIPNETPLEAKVDEDGRLIHDHDWLVTGKVLGKVFRQCRVCGQQLISAT